VVSRFDRGGHSEGGPHLVVATSDKHHFFDVFDGDGGLSHKLGGPLPTGLIEADEGRYVVA
jgi:hypothetical protein